MMNKILETTVREALKEGRRLDGRGLDDFRPIKVETGVIEKAEGSAQVTIGNTRVLAGIKMNVGTPFPDTPDKGVLMTGAEFTAMSHEEFEPGPPGEDAIEVARVTDRTIREGQIIDTSKLVIEAGEKVWMVFADIYSMNADGNMFDSSTLAVMAALKTAKMPEFKDDKVNWEVRKNPIPIDGEAVSVTFAKIGGVIIADPTRDEQDILDARMTVGIKDGRIVALQKGGDGGFTDKELEEVLDRALKHSKKLLKALK